MLGQRIVTAAILLIVALGALWWLPNRIWSIATAVVMLIGAAEWSRLAAFGPGQRIAFIAAVAVSCGVLIAAVQMESVVTEWLFPTIWVGSVVFWIALALPWLLARWNLRHRGALAFVGWWVLVPTWLAVARLQEQPAVLLMLMAIVWIADTAAYFTGRAFGRHKLAPLVSPGKTWEGVAGAAACVLVYAVGLGLFHGSAVSGVTLLVVLALAMGALSIVGDLFESWMKRKAGVKDSGRLLPGHGGILDRIDGLTASLPLAALVAGATTLF
ncbi:MAG: phosphatidate cytidylyltransferase [Burkholderiales bacterium]|nr:phosphatidate cytidylyltransferase [Burkholderiales bacterium]